MGAYIDILDFEKLFVNYFLGNMELFFFAFIIIFGFVAGKFNMSNGIFFTLLAISAVLFAVFLGEAIYILVLVLVGFAVFKATASFLT